VPGEILGQLGNRIQHALRAFTPRDQKAVKTAAETFAANPKLDVAKAISQLRVGEALVSTLQENGVPLPVERALMAPPRCRMGAITAEERAATLVRSPVGCEIRPSRQSRIGVRDPHAPQNGSSGYGVPVPGIRARCRACGEARGRHAARLALGDRSAAGNGGIDGQAGRAHSRRSAGPSNSAWSSRGITGSRR
jgi:hypothetical protein